MSIGLLGKEPKWYVASWLGEVDCPIIVGGCLCIHQEWQVMLEQGRFQFGVGECSPRMCGTPFMGSVCAPFVTLAVFGIERAA